MVESVGLLDYLLHWRNDFRIFIPETEFHHFIYVVDLPLPEHIVWYLVSCLH